VVRLAIPLTTFEQALGAVYFKMSLAAVIIAVIAAGISFWMSKRLSQPLVEMRRGAEDFVQGKFTRKLWVPNSAEIGSLAESLNKMALQLDERLRTVMRQRNELEAVLGSMAERCFSC